MSVTPLAARKNSDPPERAALREPIAVAAAARKKVSATEAAIERAEGLVQTNRVRLEAATKAVATAQAEDAKQLAAAIAVGGSSPARATRQARAAEIEAGDDVENARRALATLRVDLEDIEREAARADKAVDSALAERLKPTALLLIEKARDHHARFVATSEALSAITRLFTAWDGGEITKQANRVAAFTDEDARMAAGVRQQWQAAIEALKVDADAELPNDTPPP